MSMTLRMGGLIRSNEKSLEPDIKELRVQNIEWTTYIDAKVTLKNDKIGEQRARVGGGCEARGKQHVQRPWGK